MYARPDAEITPVCTAGQTGLVGTIALTIREVPDGEIVAPRTTAGIVEVAAGVYAKTLRAPVTAGPYLLTWDNGDPDDTPSLIEETLEVTYDLEQPTGGPLKPTRAEVAAVLRARTRSDATGGEAGTFDEHTRPTGTEVDAEIDQATIEVGLRLPSEPPEDLIPYAKRLVAIRAAMAVELSYQPEQSANSPSAYERLRDLYETGLVALQDVLQDRHVGTTTRIASIPIISDTLAPYPDELREIMQNPWADLSIP